MLDCPATKSQDTRDRYGSGGPPTPPLNAPSGADDPDRGFIPSRHTKGDDMQIHVSRKDVATAQALAVALSDDIAVMAYGIGGERAECVSSAKELQTAAANAQRLYIQLKAMAERTRNTVRDTERALQQMTSTKEHAA